MSRALFQEAIQHARLYHGAMDGDGDAIAQALADGASPDQRFPDFHNGTALHACVLASDLSGLDQLIRGGARLNERDTCGRTPLLIAALNGRWQAYDRLKSAGADDTVVDDDGRVPRALRQCRARRRRH